MIWLVGKSSENLQWQKNLMSEEYDFINFATVVELIQKVENLSIKSLPSLIILSLGSEESLVGGKVFKLLKRFQIPTMILTKNLTESQLSYYYRNGVKEVLLHPICKTELRVKVNFYSKKYLSFPRGKVFEKLLQSHKKSKVLDSLTQRESDILDLFLLQPDYKVSRSLLLSSLWGNIQVHHKTVEVHLCNLRNKIKQFDLNIDRVDIGVWKLVSRSKLSDQEFSR